MSGSLGVIPVGAGSSVVLEQLHGRPLVAHALAALSAVTDRTLVLVEPSCAEAVRAVVEAHAPGVRVLGVGSAEAVAVIRELGADVVLLHDARCPLLPASELERVLGLGVDAAVGVRPVTDTVKTVERRDGVSWVVGTLDRDAYRSVCSPLALSAHAVEVLTAGVGPAWWTLDLWRIVTVLGAQVPVELVEVSWLGRRVEDEAALHVLGSVAPDPSVR